MNVYAALRVIFALVFTIAPIARFVVLALFLFATEASAASAASAAEVVIEDGFAELSLGKSLELAYDETGALTFDDVRGGKVPFAPSTKDVPSFGYRTGATWARFTVDDRRPESAESLVWEFAYGQTDRLEVFDRRDVGDVGEDHSCATATAPNRSFPVVPLRGVVDACVPTNP